MGTKTQKLSNVVDQIVEWQSVFTGDGSTGLTAVAGRGYFIDTTSGAVTVTLPASPKQGDIVQLKDYARTWNTNAVTIASALFDGSASQTPSFSTNGQTVTLVYMDGTKGWSLVNEDTTTSLGAIFISATGGTVTESGDYKIHTFTGDGCFVVSQIGNPAGGGEVVDYLVVAGGGGAGGAITCSLNHIGGAGGAGGYRESSGTASGCYTISPLGACVPGITVTATTYPITVGAGGSGGASVSNPGEGTPGTRGSNSIFSTITSAGGGGGVGARRNAPFDAFAPGGSGGGGQSEGNPSDGHNAGGTGNSPPVSPPQGNPGGVADDGPTPTLAGGGGGGAGGAGESRWGVDNGNGGDGGQAATSSINGTPTARAGGGGGAGNSGVSCLVYGGGGQGGYLAFGCNGTANTGGGAGGTGSNIPGGPTAPGASGGKGIVIIRYKYQ